MSNIGEILLSFAAHEATAHPDFAGRLIGHGFGKILAKHNVDPAIVDAATQEAAALVTDAIPVLIEAIGKK